MKNPGISRRTVLKGSAALLAGAAFSTRVMADAPPPEPVTPALIEAAKKEGKVSYYTSTDLPVAEKLAKAFEAKYPGIAVRVERTVSERVLQRICQEYGRDLSDAARSRLGLVRTACQAEHHAGAILGGSTEKARSRRTSRHG